MKIGFISDLHVDMNKLYKLNDYIDTLSRIIDEKQLESLVIGGDIANHYSITISFVEQLQHRSQRPIYFVPGNHDYWEMAESHKQTLKIYDEFTQHPQSLIKSPLILNDDTAIIGHNAWYNHAYHGPQFNEDQLERGRFKLSTWQDKRHLDWQDKDKEVSKLFADQIEKDILSVKANNLILVTHMITIKDYTVPMPNRAFDFFNAFIATDDLDNIYRKYPISTSFMGHVHFRHQKKIEDTRYVVNSLGYYKEWHQNDLYQELNAAIYILTV